MNKEIKKNNLLLKIRKNWKFLHDEDFPLFDDITLFSHESFSLSHGIKVNLIDSGCFLNKVKKLDKLYNLFYSLKILYKAKKKLSCNN